MGTLELTARQAFLAQPSYKASDFDAFAKGYKAGSDDRLDQLEIDRLTCTNKSLTRHMKMQQAELDAYAESPLGKRVVELEIKNFDLKQQVPSVENGTNRYGLDVAYFRKTINRELNRSLGDFKPDEIARVFARLSVTADSSVIHESEFNK